MRTAAPARRQFVRNVCGFFATAGFAANARSLRKSVVRDGRSPARMIALVVGFGTVLSPRANWRITGSRDERRIRGRVRRLLRPLGVVDQLLDRGSARNGVDDDREVAKRDVLVEVVERPHSARAL